jgi:hypothetical protein
MNKQIRKQMRRAVRRQNAYDLYDALADNGYESTEVWRNGSSIVWLTQYILQLLAADARSRAVESHSDQMIVVAEQMELA